MSGGDRYQDALLRLAEVHKMTKGAPLTVDQHLAWAQVEATLALASTAALPLILKYVGEDDCALDAVTDWARTITPNRSAIAKPSLDTAATRPGHWPPQLGDVWEDGSGDRWVSESSGALVRLADRAERDPAGALILLGPWHLKWRPCATAASSDAPKMPAGWPPKPGEQWRDAKDDIWFVMGTGKLVCLADDLNEVRGIGPTPHDAVELHSRSPLRRVMAAVDGWDDEVPF